jgi:hypothetical protein
MQSIKISFSPVTAKPQFKPRTVPRLGIQPACILQQTAGPTHPTSIYIAMLYAAIQDLSQTSPLPTLIRSRPAHICSKPTFPGCQTR